MERFFTPDFEDITWKMALPASLPVVAVLKHKARGYPLAMIAVASPPGLKAPLWKIVFRQPEDRRMNMEVIVEAGEMVGFTLRFIDAMYTLRPVLAPSEEAVVFERFLQTFIGEHAVLVETKEDTPDADRDARQTCFICLDKPADTLVLPCMHSCVCRTCSALLKASNDANVCVQCRRPITGVFKDGDDSMEVDDDVVVVEKV